MGVQQKSNDGTKRWSLSGKGTPRKIISPWQSNCIASHLREAAKSRRFLQRDATLGKPLPSYPGTSKAPLQPDPLSGQPRGRRRRSRAGLPAGGRQRAQMRAEGSNLRAGTFHLLHQKWQNGSPTTACSRLVFFFPSKIFLKCSYYPF